MRKLIDLSKLFHKLPNGIVKSDSEGNLSAASSEDIAGAIAPGTFAASDHNHDDSYTKGIASSEDGEIALFDGVTGKQLKASGALLSTLMAYSLTNQRTGTAVKIWVGTEAQYQAIPSPDPNTLYFRS